MWGRSWSGSISRGVLASSKHRTTSMSRRREPALRHSQLAISSFALRTPMSHGLSRRSFWSRSWSASTSRGLFVSSRDHATSMSRRHEPALRRPQLVISSLAPRTPMSHGPSGRSLWGRSRPASTLRDLLAYSEDRATSMSRRHGPVLRRALLVISAVAPRTCV